MQDSDGLYVVESVEKVFPKQSDVKGGARCARARKAPPPDFRQNERPIRDCGAFAAAQQNLQQSFSRREFMKKVLLTLCFVALNVAAYGQTAAPRQPLGDLSVEFMLRGYFYAGSKVEDKKALGGFGGSNNLPRAVATGMSVPAGKISLIALPDEEAVFAEKYKGMKLLLVNATNEQAAFSASDSRLSIVQEALDRDGKWKPVEYLPSSWCGNSYHRIFLGAGEYWEFAAARFTGEFRTKLRFRLDEQKSSTANTTVYSNEFDGGVNVKQFTVQQGHNPAGLMDPYNN